MQITLQLRTNKGLRAHNRSEEQKTRSPLWPVMNSNGGSIGTAKLLHETPRQEIFGQSNLTHFFQKDVTSPSMLNNDRQIYPTYASAWVAAHKVTQIIGEIRTLGSFPQVCGPFKTFLKTIVKLAIFDNVRQGIIWVEPRLRMLSRVDYRTPDFLVHIPRYHLQQKTTSVMEVRCRSTPEILYIGLRQRENIDP